MPHAVCYYHFVWSTKHRQSLITSPIEILIANVISTKSHSLRCPIHALNMVSDHIHIAVSIHQSIAVSEWVRQVKSLSSLIVRREFGHLDDIFRWQTSYSVHTFGRKALPFVTTYVENQKIHHAQNTLEHYLEHISDE